MPAAFVYVSAGFAYAPDATVSFLREAQDHGARVYYSQAALDFITDEQDAITGVLFDDEC